MRKIYFIGLFLIGILFIAGCGPEESPTKAPTTQPTETILTTQAVVDEPEKDVEECIPDWLCSAWSECSSEGIQTRTCEDENNCGLLTAKPKESQSCTPPSTELELNIGETAKTSELEVTVKTAEVTDSFSYYDSIWEERMTERADPEKTFVIIEVEIKNVGNDEETAYAGEFSVTDSEGYRYEQDYKTYYFDDEALGLVSLYPNQKAKGKILFEIPEDATELKIQYNFGLWDVKLASWIIA